jgi:hypothetical protein
LILGYVGLVLFILLIILIVAVASSVHGHTGPIYGPGSGGGY